jgi:hypothetical protein
MVELLEGECALNDCQVKFFFFDLPASGSRSRGVEGPVQCVPMNGLHARLKFRRRIDLVARGALVCEHGWWGGFLVMQSAGSGVSSVEGRWSGWVMSRCRSAIVGC